jgi:hypothetical protein
MNEYDIASKVNVQELIIFFIEPLLYFYFYCWIWWSGVCQDKPNSRYCCLLQFQEDIYNVGHDWTRQQLGLGKWPHACGKNIKATVSNIPPFFAAFSISAHNSERDPSFKRTWLRYNARWIYPLALHSIYAFAERGEQRERGVIDDMAVLAHVSRACSLTRRSFTHRGIHRYR